jgi:hypothetical protein
MDDKKEPEKIRVEFKNAYEIRGYFIDRFTNLEQMMDMYLARYFFKGDNPKAIETRTILIDRLTFESKKNALKYLLDAKSDRDFKAGKYGNHNKNYKKLVEDIVKLGKIRNYFAHYQAMLPSGQNDGILVRLVEGRDTFKVIKYTTSQFEGHINTIYKCFLAIKEIPFED